MGVSLYNPDRHEAPPGSPLLGGAGQRSASGDPLLLGSRGEARPQDGGRPWRGCLQVDLHRRHGRLPSHGRPPACLGHHGSCARGAAARADFLKVQEEIMAKHAAEENMVEMEETEMERKRRDAEPVVVPTHTNVLPTTYHHLA